MNLVAKKIVRLCSHRSLNRGEQYLDCGENSLVCGEEYVGRAGSNFGSGEEMLSCKFLQTWTLIRF